MFYSKYCRRCNYSCFFRTARHNRLIVCLYALFCLLLLQIPPVHASDDYSAIEERKAKLHELQDLLRIRKIELELDRVRQEREKLGDPQTPAREKAAATTTPQTPVAVTERPLAGARLIEIFDQMAVIEYAGMQHELHRGGHLHDWTLSRIDREQVVFTRGKKTLKLNFQRSLPKKAPPAL